MLTAAKLPRMQATWRSRSSSSMASMRSTARSRSGGGQEAADHRSPAVDEVPAVDRGGEVRDVAVHQVVALAGDHPLQLGLTKGPEPEGVEHEVAAHGVAQARRVEAAPEQQGVLLGAPEDVAHPVGPERQDGTVGGQQRIPVPDRHPVRGGEPGDDLVDMLAGPDRLAVQAGEVVVPFQRDRRHLDPHLIGAVTGHSGHAHRVLAPDRTTLHRPARPITPPERPGRSIVDSTVSTGTEPVDHGAWNSVSRSTRTGYAPAATTFSQWMSEPSSR